MASVSQVITWRCCECGKLKGETNHWLVLSGPDGAFHIRPFSPPPFEDELALCGDECAQKSLQKYLRTLTNARRQSTKPGPLPRPAAIAEK